MWKVSVHNWILTLRHILRRSRPKRPTVGPTPASITHFYRYCSAEHLEWLQPLILKHQLYLPTAKQLNDPRDGKPRFANVPRKRLVMKMKQDIVFELMGEIPEMSRDDLVDAALSVEELTSGAETEQLLWDLAEDMYAGLDHVRIYSMSKRWNNLALWAKYAQNHCGYCLEFARTGFFSDAREVIYDDSLLYDPTDLGHCTFDWCFCKSPEWSNEEEVRVVVPPRKVGKNLYTDTEAVFSIEPKCLTRIILGGHMSGPNAAKIQEWAKLRDPQVAVAVALYDPLKQALALGTLFDPNDSSSTPTDTTLVLKYRSGEDIRRGDHVLFHGNPAAVEVVSCGPSDPNPVVTWHRREFGDGVLISEVGSGRTFISKEQLEYERLEFVSRSESI